VRRAKYKGHDDVQGDGPDCRGWRGSGSVWIGDYQGGSELTDLAIAEAIDMAIEMMTLQYVVLDVVDWVLGGGNETAKCEVFSNAGGSTRGQR
jgi:hypothetical protein